MSDAATKPTLNWRRAEPDQQFHDGDSIMAVMMTRHRVTGVVFTDYRVIYAIGDSETPLSFRDDYGDHVDWEEVTYWVPLDEFPLPPDPWKEQPHE